MHIHLFLLFLLILILNLPVSGQDIFIPKEFEEGQLIEQIILISDVDGVIREGVGATADPRIIEAIKSLLENEGINVAFISGTPIENDLTVESWRRGNVPLSRVFGSSFQQELFEERVAIYGVLGGHCMTADGAMKVVDEYSPEISYELGKLLIHAFLREVLHNGNHEQKNIASHLQIELDSLTTNSSAHSANLTADEFYQIIKVIQEHLDPSFRLVTNGALVETHTSNPPWGASLSSKWLKEEINQPQHMIFNLPASQKQIATGFAKKEGDGFNYLLISKTNKGLTTKKHIEETMKRFPKALVITIGDTQVDFPMHQNAHLAFHVGLKEVLLNNPLTNCTMICNSEGKDAQHVEGTLQILKFLKEAIGKSFYDLKYIPKRDSFDQWNYYSIREIRAIGL